MRLVFMGTPDFALHGLKALIAAGHDILCVYSQPPRPAGRGQALRPSPVHSFAVQAGIEVRTPLTLKHTDEARRFADLKADAAIVIAYGLLLPVPFLNAPRLGCLNLHASLLPRWRGAAPIQRAIMAGDTETGVCLMRMEKGLDTGPVADHVSLCLSPEMTAGDLHDRLAEEGAALLVRNLQREDLHFTPQNDEGVSYAGKIDKLEARLNWTEQAMVLRRHIHGLSPFPGAWCEVRGQRVKILRCRVEAGEGPPGKVIDDALLIACGQGALRLLELQREGKGPMKADAFQRGFALPAGDRLT